MTRPSRAKEKSHKKQTQDILDRWTSACSRLNDCDNCPHLKQCQEVGDRFIENKHLVIKMARKKLNVKTDSRLLDNRDRRVLELLAEGGKTEEIARREGYARETISRVISEIKEKLHAKSIGHAVYLAMKAGILT